MHDIHASPESCSHSISRLLKDCVTTQPFLVQQTVISVYGIELHIVVLAHKNMQFYTITALNRAAARL